MLKGAYTLKQGVTLPPVYLKPGRRSLVSDKRLNIITLKVSY